jgi:hypothetical protein
MLHSKAGPTFETGQNNVIQDDLGLNNGSLETFEFFLFQFVVRYLKNAL